MTDLRSPHSPAPSPETEADTAFWNRASSGYAARPVSNVAAWEATLDRVRAHLTPDMRVLELGCGTGSTALKLAPSVARYEATDYASGMIDIARAKPGADGIAFRVAGPEEAGGSYDAILAFNLLHLVPDIEGALAAVHDRLVPGGLFISKTTCLGRYTPLRPAIAVMRWIGKAPRVRYLGVADYDRMIRDAGFGIVETGSYPKAANRFVVARRD